MKSLLKAGCMAVLALAAQPVLALGVGNLRVGSLQGAPLEAEVDVMASLDQMEAAWTVEILEDRSGERPLEAHVFASLAGSVQRAPDGSLFVAIRSSEPVPGPEISFRLRLVSQQEAVVARMAGTLLPLPKPPPMAQRLPRERPAPARVVEAAPSAAAPVVPAAEVVTMPRVIEAVPPSPGPATAATPPTGVSPPSSQSPGVAVADEPMAGDARGETPPSTASAATPEASPAGIPDGQAATEATVPGPVDGAAVPAAAAPAGVVNPAPSATAIAPRGTEPVEVELPWTELLGFSITQGLAVATGLAVLVVLLVMRRRLATIVLGRFTALRDDTLKAQMASKLEASAVQKAQAAGVHDAPAAPSSARLEVDLNAEIDVLLAYAEYGKAEEKLQAALREAPNNVQARLRLAELRYITEDSAGFVDLVEQIQARHRSELTDEQWQKLTRMGKIVAPDAALFAGPRVVQRDAS